jgi:dienelactone hydrolase
LYAQDYTRIACIGASMGGTACLKAATQNDLVGIAVISSTMSLGPPTDVTPGEITALAIPKLFLYAENDRSISELMTRMYELAVEPKRIRSFPGDAHGTEMFAQSYKDEFTGELLLFLEALR